MSSFLLKKKHMREALLFCFNLKKSATESHRMLVEAYGNNVLSETTCRDWFRRFNDDNFDWVTRSLKIGPGRLKTVNCRLFWTKTISNRKKCLPSNWMFLKQPFPCSYMPWAMRWAALRFLRRCPKMAWWVVCLERWGIFLAWYTQIARKMGKMYS